MTSNIQLKFDLSKQGLHRFRGWRKFAVSSVSETPVGISPRSQTCITMQDAILLQRKKSDDGQEEPVSGLHNNSTFHGIESFLESVLVPSPVSISAELVPAVLSRGLGLETYSESLGQQGSNDRRSGRQRSSVSNGIQGKTNTNNNNTVTGAGAAAGAVAIAGAEVPVEAGVPVGTPAAAGGSGGAPKVRFELIESMNSKDEAKNNLVTMNRHPSNARNNQVGGDGSHPEESKGLRDADRRRKTRKRDNNSTAGGTSRKKKTKESDKLGSPAGNLFPLPSLPPPGGMGQYVFGMPQMGLPSQMAPQQLQQMQQQLQQQMQMSQMGQMGQVLPQAYMYGPPIQLPDGRIAGFYPGMDQFSMPENVDKDPDHTVKRSRLVWTSDLHKKFLDAVERCGGIDQALPKAIMNDMKVVGLTRENVSSHLQKYRIRVKERAERKAEGGDAPEEVCDE